jgi:hypothetical protein
LLAAEPVDQVAIAVHTVAVVVAPVDIVPVYKENHPEAVHLQNLL